RHLGLRLYVRGECRASVTWRETCPDQLGATASHRGSNMARVYSVVARCFNAFSLAAQGRFRDAEASAERCLGLADATDTPFLRALAAWAIGNAQLGRGPSPEAGRKLEGEYHYCENAELLASRPWIATDLGYARRLSGRVEEARGLLAAPSKRRPRTDCCPSTRSGTRIWARRSSPPGERTTPRRRRRGQ